MPVDLTPILPYVPVWLMILFRLTGIFVLAPVLGSSSIPRTVKVFLALGLSFAIWPMLWIDPEASGNLAVAVQNLDLWSLGLLVALELLIGYVIGYAASLPLTGMQLGGHIIDQQMGLAVAEQYNPEIDGQAGVTAQLLFWLALALFIAAGGLNVMLHTLAQTFRYVPLGGFAGFDQIVTMVVGMITIMFELGLRVAAPLLCLMFLISVGMGFLMRTVPTFNILSVGFSIRILSSLIIMMMLIGAIAGAYGEMTGQILGELMRFFDAEPPPPPGPKGIPRG
ncbi:MAG: flagellar biosynthetic protein FliR [Planctomycetota bacterium]